MDLDIEELNIQKEELTEVRWFSMKELEDMVNNNELNKNQVAFFRKCEEFIKEANYNKSSTF